MELRDVYRAIAKGEDILCVFPSVLAEELSGVKNIAIAEISGRDSIAAALKFIMDGGGDDILPVADDIPPQYGDFNEAFSPVFWLRKKAEEYGARVHSLIFIKEHELYKTLVAKYMREVISHYGFYTPCIPCHMYFHTIRAPLVKALGGSKIIGGERDSHDGRIKPSQIPMAIDYYKKAVRELGSRLVLPLRHIVNTKEIISFTYEEDTQLSCMFKELHGDLSQSIMQNTGKLRRFLEEFVMPINLKLIRALTTDENADIPKLANEFMDNLDK